MNTEVSILKLLYPLPGGTSEKNVARATCDDNSCLLDAILFVDPFDGGEVSI